MCEKVVGLCGESDERGSLEAGDTATPTMGTAAEVELDEGVEVAVAVTVEREVVVKVEEEVRVDDGVGVEEGEQVPEVLLEVLCCASSKESNGVGSIWLGLVVEVEVLCSITVSKATVGTQVGSMGSVGGHALTLQSGAHTGVSTGTARSAAGVGRPKGSCPVASGRDIGSSYTVVDVDDVDCNVDEEVDGGVTDEDAVDCVDNADSAALRSSLLPVWKARSSSSAWSLTRAMLALLKSSSSMPDALREREETKRERECVCVHELYTSMCSLSKCLLLVSKNSTRLHTSQHWHCRLLCSPVESAACL
jgi:hypothetical protein